IDDHVELVARTKADGVHLGKNDMPIREARKILGDRFIIGGTANTFYDVQRHYISDANYIGCGPYRYTTTKENLSPILGIEGYTNIINKIKNAGIPLPLVAIGGIEHEDIPKLKETGINGIALSGSILRADNPVEEMKRIIREMKND
ncbi:MAG: thiamine phosphate synthase, partial [Bacteroidaceae bacterium]|nr:thiamine phosphate synthase [Bacteroidaceae bacterium]